MIKRILILIIMFILFSPIIISTDIANINPVVPGWYTGEKNEIKAWEIEFCSKYGGSEQAGINIGATSQATIALSQTTISLQGSKLAY